MPLSPVRGPARQHEDPRHEQFVAEVDPSQGRPAWVFHGTRYARVEQFGTFGVAVFPLKMAKP